MSERYEIRGKLGRGGMSAVYRAFDTVMGREVAIKRLLSLEETNLNEQASTELLEKEAAALARFQHPNIVTVYAFERDEEGPFVVMELVDGEDLHDVLADGALSWDDFQDVARQCLEPLVDAGEQNLLHRDIKPGNIMLTMTASERFVVKILDFGLAKFSQQPSTQTLDQKGSFLGSIDYIAPEQLELRPLDQRTDLYSLGCVLYYSLAQEAPFSGETPAETTMNHLHHRCKRIHELRSDVPEVVCDWLMKLIERSPSDRPPDARTALEQFGAALRGDTLEEEIPVAQFAEPIPSASEPIAVVAPTGDVSPPPTGDVSPPPTGDVAPPGEEEISVAIIPEEKPVVATAAAQTGPRRPRVPSGAVSRGPSEQTRSNRASPEPLAWWPLLLDGKKAWWIGGGIFGVLVVFALLFSGGRREDVSDRDDKTIAENEPLPAIVEEELENLPIPPRLDSQDGRPLPPSLPVTDGLVLRFHGEKGSYGRDYITLAEPGRQVAAWLNLVSEAKQGSLFRDNQDKKGENLPRLVIATSEDVAIFAGDSRGVTTNNRSALATTGAYPQMETGFTLVFFARLFVGTDRIVRISGEKWDGRQVHLIMNHSGELVAATKTIPKTKESRVSVRWDGGRVGVVSYVLDPVAGKQLLRRRTDLDQSVDSVTGEVPPSAEPFGRFAIGKRGVGDGYVDDFSNVFFEIAVYDRVLSAEEIATVEEGMMNQYLAR
ncbi:MAG: protein kinase [Verrucomicrobiota bacterium]